MIAKIKLRIPKIEDAVDLAQAANDPAIRLGLNDYFPYPYSVDDALKFIDTVLEKKGVPTDFIIDYAGNLAGVMSIFVQEDVYRFNAELGYWVAQKYWGKGIASAAIANAIAYAWTRLDIDRLYAEVFEANTASQRALIKNGFQEEYRLAKVLVKNDKRSDMICYGLRRE